MSDPTESGWLRASAEQQAREDIVSRETRMEFLTAIGCIAFGLAVAGGTYLATENAEVSEVFGGFVGVGALVWFLGGDKKHAE